MSQVRRVDRAGLASHVAAEIPCVVAGGAREWPAMQWTSAALTERIGHVPIRCKVSPSGIHPNFRAETLAEMFATEATTFGTLFETFAGPEPARRLFTGDEQYLLRVRDGVTTMFQPLRALIDDIVIPEEARATLYTIWGWFSGRGVHTGLHYDNNGCHNLNAQLAGRKRCLLYPPSALQQMELFPPGGGNPAVNCSRLDLDLAPPPPNALEATIEPGDLLFIPAWWFHAFWHLGDFNANVNFWWKPLVPTTNPVAERQAAIEART